MPDLIRKLQGDLDGQLDDLADASIALRRSIDLKRLREDPEYRQELGIIFIEEFIDKIKLGIVRGNKFADTVIKNGKAKNGS